MYTLCHSMLRSILLALALLIVIAAGLPAAGSAATPTPHWELLSQSSSSNFIPGDTTGLGGDPTSKDYYQVIAINTGGAPTDGSPVAITDQLPAGITFSPSPSDNPVFQIQDDGGAASVVPGTCDPGPPVLCSYPGTVNPGERLKVFIPVAAEPALDGASVVNQVSISGGGTPPSSAQETTAVTADSLAPGFQSSSFSLTDDAGAPVTQAGSHPYRLGVDFQLNTHYVPFFGKSYPVGSPRDIGVKLPQGLVVNPEATPSRCTEAQLETPGPGRRTTSCPTDSAVGLIHPTLSPLNHVASSDTNALYNMVPPPGSPAAFGGNIIGFGIFVHVLGGLDNAHNYVLSAEVRDLTQFGVTSGAFVELWGNPSDPSHDSRRGDCAEHELGQSCPIPASGTPLLTMPSACSGPLATEISIRTWEDYDNPLSATPTTRDDAGNPVGVTGCDQLPFDPTIDLAPTSTEADSSSGMDVDLSVPQPQSQTGLAESTLKKAVVTLPEGMALDPSAADGLAGCNESQIGLTSGSPIRFNAADPTCPDASVIGTAQVTTPLLDRPIQGRLYLADPGDNPFHSLLSGYIVAQGQGVTLKLAGRFDRDPLTGQITATFDNNPQVPFSDFKLHFKGGDRGVLVTPRSCGTYTTSSKLVPWSAADPNNPTAAETVTSTDSFQVTSGPGGGPCPDYSDAAKFTPGFSAGTVTPLGGQFSPFVLKVSRPDGQQSLKKIAVTLPLGLTAKLAGVPRCAQSAIVPGVGGSTNCPAESQVGTVTVGAGAGSSPFFLADQPVYLTDGYDGAPFGLAIDAHALAGPFDLGHVVVRTKLSIDPITTQVSADAEPLPSIIQGIPLHIRSVALNMFRSSFVLNPTSCAAQTVAGQITGGGASFADPGDDTVKSVTSPFQVGGCSDLGLSPKLAISLTGKGQTTDDKHPGVHATVSQTAGQANLKKVVVSLPLSLALDPDNANGLCEFTDGSKIDPTCPKASIVGKAVAHTTILDHPLTGPVYFVKNIRKDAKTGREIRTLPKLVIPLTGENGLRLNLVGTSSVVNNRLVTTFDNIPDAPVSDFTLDIIGGKGGILVVSGTDICKSTQVADQQIDGQNGKTAAAQVYLQTSACPLKIQSKKVGKTSVAVKISGLGAGKVTLTGKGIKKTTKTISKSTVATITAKRTNGKPGKVTVSFDPAGPAKARKTTK